MLGRLLIRILVTGLALWLADYLLADFSVAGGLAGYAVAGAVLGLLNSLVRPVVRLLTLPLVWLTLGLFTIVINVGMLWLAAYLTAQLAASGTLAVGLITISGLWALAWATLIVTVVNILFDHD
jgi:putative membrane protein